MSDEEKTTVEKTGGETKTTKETHTDGKPEVNTKETKVEKHD